MTLGSIPASIASAIASTLPFRAESITNSTGIGGNSAAAATGAIEDDVDELALEVELLELSADCESESLQDTNANASKEAKAVGIESRFIRGKLGLGRLKFSV